MTALADMLTPDERQALVDRLDRIRELADLMREPARLAGLADLQGFLERGLDALQCMGGVTEFIDTVTAREQRLMRALLVGDATFC